MKKTIIMAAILLIAGTAAKAQTMVGDISYALPQTTLDLSVSGVRTVFHAGVYAQYAKKYLGIDVRTEDEEVVELTLASLQAYDQPDQSTRYSAFLHENGSLPALLQMTPLGIVSGSAKLREKPVGNPISKFDLVDKSDPMGETLANLGLSAHPADSVVKALADTILFLRSCREKILTGNTDADYTGGAMQTAIDELKRMETECLSLFVGYTTTNTFSGNFQFVPESSRGKQTIPAFRLSERGILGPENSYGQLFNIVIEPESFSLPEQKFQEIREVKGQAPKTVDYIYYQIPAACAVRVETEQHAMIINSRINIYQAGKTAKYPIIY